MAYDLSIDGDLIGLEDDDVGSQLLEGVSMCTDLESHERFFVPVDDDTELTRLSA